MKILSIAPEPFFQQRGTPMSVYYRTKAICELGHQVDILTYHLGSDVAIKGAKIYRIWRVPFINEVKIGPSFTKVILDPFLVLKAVILLLKNRYDAIHAHEEAAYFSVFLKKLFKVKLIYDMHSNLSQQLANFNFMNNKLCVGAFDFLDRLTIRSADAVITICPDLNKAVEKAGTHTPYFLIENSLISEIQVLAPQGAKPRESEHRTRENLNGKTMILYAGTFERYQGIPLLLESISEVVREFKDVTFVLAGGTESQVMEMKEMAKSLAVEKSVIFTGNLSTGEVNRLVEKAQILVSPRTKGTNTPLKIYSYLHSGKPIVATDLYTHRQVLNTNVAVLTEATPCAFAQGIKRLLRNNEFRAKIGREAQNYYEAYYGEKHYKEKLSQLFAALGAH